MPRRRNNEENPIAATPLAKWLNDALTSRGISAYRLSEISGVTHATISLILSGKSGKRRGAEKDTIELLARHTMPENADEISIRHHINRGLVANGMLPDPVPGGAFAVVREGEPPQYLTGEPPIRTRLRTGEEVELYPTGTNFVLTDELMERFQFEAELEKRRREQR